jgi:hypothetical protein
MVLLAQTILFPVNFDGKSGDDDDDMDIPDIVDIVISSCGIIYSIYEMWVVYAFISETKVLKDIVSGSPTVNTTV